ncbi:DUF817 family protein [Arthrobacter methylotrophus]|uniref:DUF817 family protein n=2 Tax=Arthrobacter methylotrophus TaxID=121291 RepID=A0ABV5UW27_9MICC
MRELTAIEELIDGSAARFVGHSPAQGLRSRLTEFTVFGLKQAWACVFGASLLAVIFAAHLWYPADAALARNDFMTIAAVVIQIVMVATKPVRYVLSGVSASAPDAAAPVVPAGWLALGVVGTLRGRRNAAGSSEPSGEPAPFPRVRRRPAFSHGEIEQNSQGFRGFSTPDRQS